MPTWRKRILEIRHFIELLSRGSFSHKVQSHVLHNMEQPSITSYIKFGPDQPVQLRLYPQLNVADSSASQAICRNKHVLSHRTHTVLQHTSMSIHVPNNISIRQGTGTHQLERTQPRLHRLQHSSNVVGDKLHPLWKYQSLHTRKVKPGAILELSLKHMPRRIHTLPISPNTLPVMYLRFLGFTRLYLCPSSHLSSSQFFRLYKATSMYLNMQIHKPRLLNQLLPVCIP